MSQNLVPSPSAAAEGLRAFRLLVIEPGLRGSKSLTRWLSSLHGGNSPEPQIPGAPLNILREISILGNFRTPSISESNGYVSLHDATSSSGGSFENLWFQSDLGQLQISRRSEFLKIGNSALSANSNQEFFCKTNRFKVVWEENQSLWFCVKLSNIPHSWVTIWASGCSLGVFLEEMEAL